MKKNINPYIKKYLENRPLFFSLIRPQEVLLFKKSQTLIKEPILDFGCGGGFFAELAFGKEKIEVGLDLKNERTMLAENKKVYKKIVYYDGIKIPYRDNYFSTVISNSVLEHIPEFEKSLKEIYRILKPDGYFLTSVMTNNWKKNLLLAKIFGSEYVKFMKKMQVHFNLLSATQWTNNFKKTGLNKVSVYGYLSKSSCYWLDILHYISIPSLITYRLFKKWVFLPGLLANGFIIRAVSNLSKEKVSLNDAAALFFVLRK